MRRLLLLIPLLAIAAGAAPVSLTSLLSELTDRGALAKLPSPAYTCRQFSSYDPAAKSPDENWFANGDANHFLRKETVDGRTEHVLMDVDGPGAIVRIWSANPPEATLRVYLDGRAEPVLAENFQKLLNGAGLVGKPLSEVCSRGWNLYVPLPYAKHCKVTSDKPGFYYQINYRTYAPGTAVESLKAGDLALAQDAIGQVNATLASLPGPVALGDEQTIAPGKTLTRELPTGGFAVTALAVNLAAEDLDQALRSTVLTASFDGEPTIWCPVGDFFGTGIGINPYRDWYRQVDADGTMTCRWVMPYRSAGQLTLQNLGQQPVRVQLGVETSAAVWDERSMHFHATWRSEYPIHTRPMQDWNYLSADGQGVYAGDSLVVMNPVAAWWGEGDEKIYVDGETFPSHFGTGTEDYYGYAWCSNQLFTSPFHAQPRCDGPGNFGHTTVSRVRMLDGIPFTKRLRFDMEVWHWAETDVAYAATTYWYGRPGVTSNRAPQPDEAARAIPQPPPPFVRPNHVEAETMTVVAKSEGVTVEVQDTGGYGFNEWSGNQHFWVRGQRPGDFIELRVPAPAGKQKVTLYGTKSWDYGLVTFSINGQPTGIGLDLFSEKVRPTGPVALGAWEPVDGHLTLRVEVVAHNPAAKGTGAFLGIDGLVLEPVE